MTTQDKTQIYMLSVITAGLACLAAMLINLPLHQINVQLLFLVAFTIGFGSRITLRLPKFKSHIAVSDTFIFFALLYFGGEIAVVLAALEAFFSSIRFCKKKITIVFNIAASALSFTIVFLTLQSLGLFSESVLNNSGGSITNNFLTLLCVMALTQFIANTSLAAVYGALKSDKPLWETWKSHYLWIFITYFAGAFGAGLLIKFTNVIGFGIVIAVIPIIFFVYQTYRMYLKNVEMSISQAEQAKQYAEILEKQSAALRESEERFRSAFDYAPIGIALVSPNGSWLKVNRAMREILGYAEEEFLESNFQSMLHQDDLGNTLIKISELLIGKIQSCQSEQRYINKNKNIVWASWSVSKASDVESSDSRLIFQIQDITDKKSVEDELQYKATHDALTGLPNRAMFMSRLEQAIEKAQILANYRVSVLFIDLDRFKVINDSLGHLIGDQLLVEISARLRDCLRPTDTVARLGGDEFTILVEGNHDPQEVIGIAQRIQDKFVSSFDLSGNEVYSSASIGILHNSEKHLTPEDMMRDADTAMYQAKRGGKARHETFNSDMHDEVKEILALENDLRRAVEKDEFSVYFQPIYSIKTRKIQGFEALARWKHEIHGYIPPDKFIPLAEEIGLIDTLGLQILRKACTQGGKLKNEFPANSPFTMSVNLSCKQFAQSNLVENIKEVLRETNFDPTQLKLEITESVFIEHRKKSIEMLHQLREIGVEINIDDFGTGYSNLSYLMKLPISTLKIDRSFINPLDAEGRGLEIVQTILTLACSLGIKVIAEGVENESQLNQLENLNCEGAQGFLFAKPMEFDKLIEFLHAENQTSINLPVGIEDLPTTSTVH